ISVNQSPATILLKPSLEKLDQIVVTSRRRKEQIQDIPIPITTINAATIDDASAFNVNRIKELAPSVQLYASNARNTTLNIRGLGSTYGLTNDGIDPGVEIGRASCREGWWVWVGAGRLQIKHGQGE